MEPLQRRRWGYLATKHHIAMISLAIAIIGLVGAGLVFIEVQVLQSYPFHSGVYGNQYLFPDVTYTEALEIFALITGAGLFARGYYRAEGTHLTRIMKGAGITLITLGLIVAPIVYVETRLLWGEILPGVRVWQGLPGGGGYPWGGEQVAYNSCFISPSALRNCAFLNYDELFWLAVLAVVIGYVLKNRYSKTTKD